ncbi:hypothetical protein [Mariniflexile sp. AS56]|uniref:hypothetical protein n=1 Tax=Mariniflexile sp. AS56 TaxID=3063957 RepID=UPI0026EBFB9F|nr:hypothetical protein [Mariniflexile sp. AS56]MDO7172574.1 hypothetical protein [Mariniflexile sp. AS56]
MNKNIKITDITKKVLRRAIEENTFWKTSLSPFPKSKAIWLVSNSRIEEDDYCGVIVHENDKIVTFIYLIPDYLNTNNTEIKKVYWMILWWVDSAYKNTVLGNYIYSHALNLTNNQILIKAYTQNVDAFYGKQPYRTITTRLRHTLFFSLNTSSIIGRFPFLKRLKFIIDINDYFTYFVTRLINKSKLKNDIKDLNYEYLNQLDEDTWKFIEPLCQNDLILKTKEYINWHIDNAQYTQTPASRQTYATLHAGISSNIHIYNLKVLKNNNIIGFISYTINYGECNVKYFLGANEDHYDYCVSALIDNLYATKAKFIFTDDTKLSDAIVKKYITVYNYKISKKGLVHNDINLSTTNKGLVLQNSDGHFY